MKIMKRFAALLMACMLFSSLAACGNSSTGTENESSVTDDVQKTGEDWRTLKDYESAALEIDGSMVNVLIEQTDTQYIMYYDEEDGPNQFAVIDLPVVSDPSTLSIHPDKDDDGNSEIVVSKMMSETTGQVIAIYQWKGESQGFVNLYPEYVEETTAEVSGLTAAIILSSNYVEVGYTEIYEKDSVWCYDVTITNKTDTTLYVNIDPEGGSMGDAVDAGQTITVVGQPNTNTASDNDEVISDVSFRVNCMDGEVTPGHRMDVTGWIGVNEDNSYDTDKVSWGYVSVDEGCGEYTLTAVGAEAPEELDILLLDNEYGKIVLNSIEYTKGDVNAVITATVTNNYSSMLKIGGTEVQPGETAVIEKTCEIYSGEDLHNMEFPDEELYYEIINYESEDYYEGLDPHTLLDFFEKYVNENAADFVVYFYDPNQEWSVDDKGDDSEDDDLSGVGTTIYAYEAFIGLPSNSIHELTEMEEYAFGMVKELDVLWPLSMK